MGKDVFVILCTEEFVGQDIFVILCAVKFVGKDAFVIFDSEEFVRLANDVFDIGTKISIYVVHHYN